MGRRLFATPLNETAEWRQQKFFDVLIEQKKLNFD
jgi:hypothetical protein